jgi:hypothetical protein
MGVSVRVLKHAWLSTLGGSPQRKDCLSILLGRFRCQQAIQRMLWAINLPAFHNCGLLTAADDGAMIVFQ